MRVYPRLIILCAACFAGAVLSGSLISGCGKEEADEDESSAAADPDEDDEEEDEEEEEDEGKDRDRDRDRDRDKDRDRDRDKDKAADKGEDDGKAKAAMSPAERAKAAAMERREAAKRGSAAVRPDRKTLTPEERKKNREAAVKRRDEMRKEAAARTGATAAGAAADRAGPALQLTKLATEAELRTSTADPTLAEQGTLSGIDASPRYNSRYFASKGHDGFGLSLQLWREGSHREANERFSRMQRDYPNAEATQALGKRAFFSYWNDIIALTLLDVGKRTILSVTCSETVCSVQELVAVVNAAKERI